MVEEGDARGVQRAEMKAGFTYRYFPRSPGTHIAGPWVVESTNLCRDLKTGTQYIGNWASRV